MVGQAQDHRKAHAIAVALYLGRRDECVAKRKKLLTGRVDKVGDAWIPLQLQRYPVLRFAGA
jgi:hypothetical protein